MFLLVKNVLSPAEVDQVRELAKAVRFIDGRASNPHNTAKNNLQADMAGAEAQRASQIAGAAIARNEEVRNFAFPRRIATPLLSRYEPGMTYGTHSDAAFLPMQPAPLRSDVSATLFLGDPTSYDGGELRIHLGSEAVSIKGRPGEMVVYPSNTLHEVVPVTRGERLCFFTFMESTIPDHVERDLLYALNEVYALEGLKMDWENRTRLQYVINSLQRNWSR
ncbi:MAG: Fe2+-dependent dioxygenase [Rhizomicrobium sp.]